ncbi:DUF881 domain-containing protein [Ornithinimicrobium flavum]|uniref:DUF881 domain-containing protein n=1 Tax=Ornithinimicrobium flavum TaxID=1288636 RepID=UPI00106FBDF6|nr:DUF881 domain-containing protein [Ornithinimicrobium flavum]
MRWPSPRVPPGSGKDPAASMALLEEVLDPPVGPGYHSAAERRLAAGHPASSGSRTWLMLAACFLLGLLAAVAATTLRAPDPAAAEGRSQLIARIEAAESAGDAQRDRVEELRAEIVELEQAAIGPDEPAAAVEIGAAGLRAGASAVTGPGVVITLDDAPLPSDIAPGEPVDRERVNARDLQLVVNGLWAAGAEAVAVNGHRLTSISAIRFAGEAIVVDFRSLAPPYEVVALGDPVALARETSSGFVGSYLTELGTQVGLRAAVVEGTDLVVPAAGRLATRVGEAVVGPPEQEQTPGAPPTTQDPTPTDPPEDTP